MPPISKVPDPNSQTALDIQHARTESLIDVQPVTHYLYGSKAQYIYKTKIVDILSNDPVFNKSKRLYLSRSERYSGAMAMTRRLYDLQRIHDWSPEETSVAASLLDEALPLTLHNVAFTPVFISQSQGYLAEQFGLLAKSIGIFGAYLQTELAHGSNVSQLETTATYLPETREFEIHSPTVTAAKWWIGGLSRTATHGVIQARLLLPSQSRNVANDLGPHLFFVQLRSLEDHKPMKGITLGDIGPKAFGGFAATDNGFAIFSHVRIPKSNMLDKFSQVTDTGEYIKPPHSKISYGGMLYIRSSMVKAAGWTAAKGVTIALRYTHVRRQGQPDPQKPGLELQVIKYPAVYYRLLPILSRSYVWIQLGQKLIQSFETMNAKLAKGDTSLLAEMHATTSGLKSLVTTQTIADLETCRRAMGGHGYSAYSGLDQTYADYLPSATFEGDNYVLDQQVVRGALKAYQSLQDKTQPANLSPSTRYLRLLSPTFKPNFSILRTSDQWRELGIVPSLTLLLEWRAAVLVKDYAVILQRDGEQGIDASAATRVSKAVTDAFVAQQVADLITSSNLPANGEARKGLINLFILHLLTTIEGGLVDLLAFNLLLPVGDVDQTHALRLAIRQICEELLPDSITLSDAFAFTDWELNSALGVYNGKVYESLLDRVKNDPINNEGTVTPVYQKHIKPLLMRGQEIVKSKL